MESIKKTMRVKQGKIRKTTKNGDVPEKKAEKKKTNAQEKKGNSPHMETPKKEESEQAGDVSVAHWADKVGMTEITEEFTRFNMRVVKKRREERDRMLTVAAATGLLSRVDGWFAQVGEGSAAASAP
ncbi:uncharacterized protein SCHCODRAFT_02612727 [Schizophyllum commune H4-8]|uniref:uncharacterized protein n=1 Tax=Schizophyllum commune (strain H4-8 / FGSC 9210) TaxID=578458 RepID=UPI00215ED777|nr:uncharacterized protein SCHCODRAFT_02612727 [Schizophyllum commune H4-8]KAI5898642.1 hypothetical protein SCHCODRAFT_02612727 [Schizophyllum commune H4-8]